MTRAWARLASLVVLAVAAIGFGGCGGHHHSHEGTLEVHNDSTSTDTVDHVTIDEVGGPDHFEVDTNLDPDESFFIDLFPSQYDVTIFWGDGSTEFHTVDVFDDFVTTLTVSN
jgi:hypothetical protein